MTRTNDVWKESNKADRNSNNATATNPEKQHHGPSALRSIWPEKERLADAIKKASGGVEYDFVNIDPEDNKDGGQPGGNIRVAYL